jgi:hypothetical protein
MADTTTVQILNSILDTMSKRVPTAMQTSAMDAQAQNNLLNMMKHESDVQYREDTLAGAREGRRTTAKYQSDVLAGNLEGRKAESDWRVLKEQFMHEEALKRAEHEKLMFDAAELEKIRNASYREKMIKKETDRQYFETYGVPFEDYVPGMQTLKAIANKKTLDAYNMVNFGTTTPGVDDKSFVEREFKVAESQAAVIDTFEYKTDDGRTIKIPVTLGNAAKIMGQNIENKVREVQIRETKRKIGEYSAFKPHNVIHIPNLSNWKTGETFVPTEYELDEDLKSKTLGSVKNINSKAPQKAWAKKNSLLGQIDREIAVMEQQSPHVLRLWDSMAPSDQAVWSTSLKKLEEYLGRWEYNPKVNWSMVGEDEKLVYALLQRLEALKAKQKFAIASSLIKAGG